MQTLEDSWPPKVHPQGTGPGPWGAQLRSELQGCLSRPGVLFTVVLTPRCRRPTERMWSQLWGRVPQVWQTTQAQPASDPRRRDLPGLPPLPKSLQVYTHSTLVLCRFSSLPPHVRTTQSSRLPKPPSLRILSEFSWNVCMLLIFSWTVCMALVNLSSYGRSRNPFHMIKTSCLSIHWLNATWAFSFTSQSTVNSQQPNCYLSIFCSPFIRLYVSWNPQLPIKNTLNFLTTDNGISY